MSLLSTIRQKIAGRDFIPVAEANRRITNMLHRTYDAGIVSRLNADLRAVVDEVDQAIRSGGPAIRSRARDLTRNNDYARGFLNQRRANIVGHLGFKLQMNVRELDPVTNKIRRDEVANAKIEDAWADWSRPANCSVHGYSFRQIQHLAQKYWTRDGEVLIHLIRNTQSKYGLRLQLLEPEALDETRNERLSNGNVIRMGVELDSAWRPVAYWIKRPNRDTLGRTYSTASDADRVPASEIIHAFERDHVTQTRGVSRLVQSMLAMHQLTEWEKASLVNARVSANKVGVISAQDNAVPDTSGLQGDSTEAGTGARQLELEPGMIFDIGMNKWNQFAPDYPSAQHEMFVRSNLRRQSVGLGVSYSGHSHDLSDANYSSNRVGLIDEREQYKMDQEDFVDQVLVPIFEAWLEAGLISGMIGLPFKYEKFNQPKFVGRRWPWVDPLKDLEAAKGEIEFLLATRAQYIAEQGGDFQDTLDALKAEKDMIAEAGLTPINTSPKTAPPKPNPPEDDSGEDEPPEAAAAPSKARAIDIEVNKKRNGHNHHEEIHQ